MLQNTELRLLARDFRARAQELLLRAETMHDKDACLKLRKIAVGYERLARRVENNSPATQ